MYMLVKINKGLKYMKNTQKQRGFDLNRITVNLCNEKLNNMRVSGAKRS